MRIACLHALERPFLGHAGPALREAGAELEERVLRRGDALPDLDDIDGLVVLGGEQSVTALDRHPELAGVPALLREAGVRGVPVLGVCLGAQLLAHAHGGTVARRPRRLVTWAPLARTDAAGDDPLVAGLPADAAGLHWNEDGLEPPPGAVELLVRPPGGATEAFRVGRSSWGVQFHPEVDAVALEHWYAGWAYALDEAGVAEADARAADARHLPGQPALSRALFGAFARVVGRSARG